MTGNRLAAAALAVLGAASAIPIPLAQLDFAGLWNPGRRRDRRGRATARTAAGTPSAHPARVTAADQ
jgi:hypothetical protein